MQRSRTWRAVHTRTSDGVRPPADAYASRNGSIVESRSASSSTAANDPRSKPGAPTHTRSKSFRTTPSPPSASSPASDSSPTSDSSPASAPSPTSTWSVEKSPWRTTGWASSNDRRTDAATASNAVTSAGASATIASRAPATRATGSISCSGTVPSSARSTRRRSAAWSAASAPAVSVRRRAQSGSVRFEPVESGLRRLVSRACPRLVSTGFEGARSARAPAVASTSAAASTRARSPPGMTGKSWTPGAGTAQGSSTGTPCAARSLRTRTTASSATSPSAALTLTTTSPSATTSPSTRGDSTICTSRFHGLYARTRPSGVPSRRMSPRTARRRRRRRRSAPMGPESRVQSGWRGTGVSTRAMPDLFAARRSFEILSRAPGANSTSQRGGSCSAGTARAKREYPGLYLRCSNRTSAPRICASSLLAPLATAVSRTHSNGAVIRWSPFVRELPMVRESSITYDSPIGCESSICWYPCTVSSPPHMDAVG